MLSTLDLVLFSTVDEKVDIGPNEHPLWLDKTIGETGWNIMALSPFQFNAMKIVTKDASGKMDMRCTTRLSLPVETHGETK